MDLIPLLSYIDANINTKTGTDKISGKQHNAVLKEVVNSVIEITGTGFGGDIAPGDNPGAQTNPIYFLASEVGTFTYCGGVQVTALPAFIVWKNNAWSLNQIGIESEETEDTGLRGIAREGDAAPSSPQLGDWYVYIGSETLQWPSQNAINKPGIVVLESVNPSANWVLTPFGDESGGGGSITVDSELNDESENPVQNKVLANRTLSSIKPDADNALKIPVVSADGTVIGYTAFTADQIVQLASMNVDDWLNQESRLIMAKNDNGTAKFEGAAELLDIIAPTDAKTSLTNKSGWVDDWKTLTGENYRGEIGRSGQRIMLDDGTLCTCEGSVSGTEGGNNGSATYKRNISANVLDPDNNTQDATVCNLLDPSRTGGSTDDGWADNQKIVAQPTRLDARWKSAGGYFYWCYALIGSNSYWMRLGSPQIKYRAINSITHPTLTANLTAYDFATNGWYAEQAGDEASVQDQTWTDEANEQYYIKVSATKWKQV